MEENRFDYNTKNMMFTVSQNDTNFIGYRSQMEEVNRKVITKLLKVSIFSGIFMLIEFFGGYIAGSLAIMSDAAHLLSDLTGFLISMFSLYIALRPANFKLTYGYSRAEVIGALSSILIIWCLTVWLVIEAVDRLYNPVRIQGLTMVGIAACGLTFNLIMSKILTSEDIPNAFENNGNINNDNMEADEEMNTLTDENKLEEPLIEEKNNPILRAAFIHILGDIIQSLGVVIASLIIYFFQDSHSGIAVIDPICTFIFAIIVVSTSIPVTKDCLNVLMEASPREIDMNALLAELTAVEGIVNIHDLHVWCISVNKPSLSMHILSNTPQKTLEKCTKICKKYGIFHTTIQTEDNTQRRRPSYNECSHIHDNTIH